MAKLQQGIADKKFPHPFASFADPKQHQVSDLAVDQYVWW
jgi:hypothetical protein